MNSWAIRPVRRVECVTVLLLEIHLIPLVEYTGAYQMQSLGFLSQWITRTIFVLLAFTIAFYLGVAVILLYSKIGIEDLAAKSLDNTRRQRSGHLRKSPVTYPGLGLISSPYHPHTYWHLHPRRTWLSHALSDPFATAFPLLCRRSFLNFRRSPPALVARTTQVLGFAVILNTYSIQIRLGFIQGFAALYFFGMLQNVAIYPTEKSVFYREHNDDAYVVVTSFLTYTVLEIPFEIITSLFFALLTVVAAGLPRTINLFFIVAFNCFAIVNCGESSGDYHGRNHEFGYPELLQA
ncbi:MAG: hypothetical protein Q9201_004078 [Fulgogasparrea decipioides]